MNLINEQNKLVSEILELVKLSGDIPFQEKEIVLLKQCVSSVLEPLSSLIETKEQMLYVDVDDDIKCELNNGLFSKAISNILLNAIQNSPNSAEIRIAARKEIDFIHLTGWNGGTDIPDAILSKLYNPFYRADEARTSGEGRSGLGLTIAKKAFELMGIVYSIKNTNGGVLFYMDIPNK
jgi:two-component system sensor histidine kinase VanS